MGGREGSKEKCIAQYKQLKKEKKKRREKKEGKARIKKWDQG